jgi:hypothetical protein
MATVLKLLRTTVSGRIPTAAQVAEGSLALNLADRRLYSKDHTGEVFSLVSGPGAHIFLHAVDGTTLYIGRLSWTDYPATGPAEDAEEWTIYKISTNASGDVTAESSATGAWSNKESLTYA